MAHIINDEGHYKQSRKACEVCFEPMHEDDANIICKKCKDLLEGHTHACRNGK